ncbi:lysophospholipase L1-like esterase/NTP pyrophosphatase (non-canonical NTP hydrolase) [Streptacidiphilus sp. BW17]|uniref:GDSL-type esterase/lipase family protein n=1 Tax=unclassified Streptacidiphilus TaxID=2643834 RepID=UPI003518A652
MPLVKELISGASGSASGNQRTLRVGWFGSSIMEHLEACNSQLVNQSGLPPIGTPVTVESWQRRGYVHRVHLSLQASWPHVAFEFDNRARGGATSRDIEQIVCRATETEGAGYDLAFVSCGINDVWRRFQGREAETVNATDFTAHYTAILRRLAACSRIVVCVLETPFGPIADRATVEAMNHELNRFNCIAACAAEAAGALVLDPWQPFVTASQQLTAGPGNDLPAGLWSDGVHLSDLGDTLLLHQVEKFLADHRTIEQLLTAPHLEHEAPQAATDLPQLLQRALEIHALYDDLNQAKRGRVWSREEFVLGFVGDVGDLAKIVMAQEGARDAQGGQALLEHELADCLWSVLILAHLYEVDLASAMAQTMDQLEKSIRSQLDRTSHD